MRQPAIIVLATVTLAAGCGHGGRGHQQRQPDAREQRKEDDAESAARRRRQAEVAKKQAADAERFHKALAVIRTVKVGDAYDDFYRKADEARLSLERVTNTADGRVERYAFMDNSTAFVTIVVKADHLTEIRMEGVGQ